MTNFVEVSAKLLHLIIHQHLINTNSIDLMSHVLAGQFVMFQFHPDVHVHIC